MQAAIRHLADCSEFYIDEGCHITELVNTAADPALSIARARVAPGMTTRWHRLDGIVERYVIVRGEGIAEIGDCPPTPVTAGDTVIIPAGERQRIHNPGDQDLIFLALCTPRFDPDAYRDTENEPA